MCLFLHRRFLNRLFFFLVHKLTCCLMFIGWCNDYRYSYRFLVLLEIQSFSRLGACVTLKALVLVVVLMLLLMMVSNLYMCSCYVECMEVHMLNNSRILLLTFSCCFIMHYPGKKIPYFN